MWRVSTKTASNSPAFKSHRLEREQNTVNLMIALWCGVRHGVHGRQLCPECLALRKYTELRLRKCFFQENKPTCAKCPIHCYSKEKREQIRQVMRFSGPRMVFRHPILAIRHLLDGRKKQPIAHSLT